jgi:serpin B
VPRDAARRQSASLVFLRPGGRLERLRAPQRSGDDVDRTLSMVVALPKTVDGLGRLERDLTPARLAAWLGALRRVDDVRVTLPRFKTSAGFDLRDALTRLGMPQAFDARQADFSGISRTREGLVLSSVLHRAHVEVNETGTEAAAATAVVAKAGAAAPRPAFRADHPFLFLIRDVQTGAIMFLGRVVDPTT